MLRTVEISAEVAGTAQGNVLHSLHWRTTLEMDLDCFWCERTRRTTVFEWGAPAAICTSVRPAPHHRTSARLERLHTDAQAERRRLHAVVGCWWSPFHDEVANTPAAPLDEDTPVRLSLGYFCHRQHRSGSDLVYPGMDLPFEIECRFCHVVMATLTTPPTLRLLA